MIICEHCKRVFAIPKSESRFDAFGRRVCRKPCNGMPLRLETGHERELFRLRAGKRTAVSA